MVIEFNEKQIHILQVAEKLFAEKGFDGTSIRDISKAAEVNVAMVSYYFGSKEKLLESLVYFRISDMKLQLESLYKEPISPLEKIHKLVELYINRVNKNRCIYQIVHFELSSKKRKIDFKSFTEVKKDNLVYLEKIISDGQKEGTFGKDINIKLIPPTILGTFFHFQMNRPFFEELLDLHTDEAFDNYIKTELIQHIQLTIKSLLLHEK